MSSSSFGAEFQSDAGARWLRAWLFTVVLVGGTFATGSDRVLREFATAGWQRWSARSVDALLLAEHGHGAAFSRDLRQRLPRYLPHFQSAAQRYGLDWRLLAAIGYQESRWDPQAVSPTGVRGLMMLTLDTADLLKIDDREDALQSIDGGARYYAQLLRRLPPSVRGPDRVSMTLAAYNQGLGHLLDARELVRARGGDPDRWADVRAVLPLLSDPQWYPRTRYGYARGQEAVDYVARVHRYHQTLIRASSPASPPGPQDGVLDPAGLRTPKPGAAKT